MNNKPLPCRPPPLEDELLSSWVSRLALANHCSVKELCGYLGFEEGREPETVAEFGQMNLDHLSFVVQRRPDALAAMLLPEGMLFRVQYVAQSDFQMCPVCTAQIPDLVLRHWRFVWSTDCDRCGQELMPAHSVENGAEIVSVKLAMRAKRGSEVLKTIFSGGNSQVARRLSRVFHMMCSMGLTESTSLISEKKVVRSVALATIGTCMSPTMPTSTPDNRRRATAVRHLSRLFPRYRKAITKIAAISEEQDEDVLKHSDGEVFRQQHVRTVPETTTSKWALIAAKQAIEELGTDAVRQKLLVRADVIWSTKKKLIGV